MTALPLALSILCLAQSPSPAAKPAAVDTVKPPAVELLLPDLKIEQVKSKVVTRLMNRNWMLSQNRNDSLDFSHSSDSALIASLFNVEATPQQRVILRFGLKNTKEGVQTRLSAFLLVPGERGMLVRSTVPADTSVLRQSLEAIQTEEFGPGMLIPTKDGPDKDKKRKKK